MRAAFPAAQGVYHVELKQTSRGARLIEVNCRMVGGTQGRAQSAGPVLPGGRGCQLGGLTRQAAEQGLAAQPAAPARCRPIPLSRACHAAASPCLPNRLACPACLPACLEQGGGVVSTMNLLVWGVDLVEEQLLCSAGEAWLGPGHVAVHLAWGRVGLADAHVTPLPAKQMKRHSRRALLPARAQASPRARRWRRSR